MGKLRKLLEKIRNNPKTVRFEELDKILISAGFTRRQSGKGSSHYLYKLGDKMLCVPFRQPHVLRVYVERAIELIGDALEDIEESGPDEERF